MTEDDFIEDRLIDVMNSIFCPISGCWPLHGGHSEFYFDNNTESHVLEVWPVAIEPEEPQGNGKSNEGAMLYELAEFDFTDLAKEVRLEHFHFSQRRSIFEMGWAESGQNLELRVHILPEEADEDY